MIATVDIFLTVLTVYLLIGVLFGFYFVIAGAKKLDEGVEGTPWHFKLIIFPGSVLLWIVLIFKIIQKK